MAPERRGKVKKESLATGVREVTEWPGLGRGRWAKAAVQLQNGAVLEFEIGDQRLSSMRQGIWQAAAMLGVRIETTARNGKLYARRRPKEE